MTRWKAALQATQQTACSALLAATFRGVGPVADRLTPESSVRSFALYRAELRVVKAAAQGNRLLGDWLRDTLDPRFRLDS